MTHDVDFASFEYRREPAPILRPDGEALTRIVAGGQQCLRCGRFEFETCNGSGLNVRPCELGRQR